MFSGFVVKGESWQQGGAREYKEETGADIDPTKLSVVQVSSTPDGARILIFAVAPSIRLADLPPFVHNDEVIERVIAYAPCELAFPLHTQVMADFFKKTFKQTYSFERLLDLEEDVFTWINSLPEDFTGDLNISITQESV